LEPVLAEEIRISQDEEPTQCEIFEQHVEKIADCVVAQRSRVLGLSEFMKKAEATLLDTEGKLKKLVYRYRIARCDELLLHSARTHLERCYRLVEEWDSILGPLVDTKTQLEKKKKAIRETMDCLASGFYNAGDLEYLRKELRTACPSSRKHRLAKETTRQLKFLRLAGSRIDSMLRRARSFLFVPESNSD
jgi:hypothetical protein